MAKKNGNSKGNGKRKRAKKTRSRIKAAGLRLPHKSLEEIAREQGKELRPWTDEDFDRLAELGKGLWKSDEEFEQFLAGIYERRRQSRGS
jgi:hypothetical protein